MSDETLLLRDRARGVVGGHLLVDLERTVMAELTREEQATAFCSAINAALEKGEFILPSYLMMQLTAALAQRGLDQENRAEEQKAAGQDHTFANAAPALTPRGEEDRFMGVVPHIDPVPAAPPGALPEPKSGLRCGNCSAEIGPVAVLRSDYDLLRARAEKVEAEAREMREDAERYRWLRKIPNIILAEEFYGERLDEEVDAARTEKGKT